MVEDRLSRSAYKGGRARPRMRWKDDFGADTDIVMLYEDRDLRRL
jgi:hypothetical protein